MTVKELIEALGKLPPDRLVVFSRHDLGYCSKAYMEEVTVKPQFNPEYFWEAEPDQIDPYDRNIVKAVVL